MLFNLRGNPKQDLIHWKRYPWSHWPMRLFSPSAHSWQSMSHPHIVKLIEVFEKESGVNLCGRQLALFLPGDWDGRWWKIHPEQPPSLFMHKNIYKNIIPQNLHGQRSGKRRPRCFSTPYLIAGEMAFSGDGFDRWWPIVPGGEIPNFLENSWTFFRVGHDWTCVNCIGFLVEVFGSTIFHYQTTWFVSEWPLCLRHLQIRASLLAQLGFVFSLLQRRSAHCIVYSIKMKSRPMSSMIYASFWWFLSEARIAISLRRWQKAAALWLAVSYCRHMAMVTKKTPTSRDHSFSMCFFIGPFTNRMQ